MIARYGHFLLREISGNEISTKGISHMVHHHREKLGFVLSKLITREDCFHHHKKNSKRRDIPFMLTK